MICFRVLSSFSCPEVRDWAGIQVASKNNTYGTTLAALCCWVQGKCWEGLSEGAPSPQRDAWGKLLEKFTEFTPRKTELSSGIQTQFREDREIHSLGPKSAWCQNNHKILLHSLWSTMKGRGPESQAGFTKFTKSHFTKLKQSGKQGKEEGKDTNRTEEPSCPRQQVYWHFLTHFHKLPGKIHRHF